MAQWVKLCEVTAAPTEGSLGEYSVHGVAVCLAHVDGRFAAVDQICPHRGGPMSEGWVEEGKVVCPWHAWAFDLKTGACPEERSSIRTYPVTLQGEDVLIDLT